ncbi:hypothetical protein KIN20_036955 [Parelaphostrongylus tenuis]|uniref:Uncharacterized protein n=1 Tax=Parelaphostrongylus tenuis TaxID=148309 RepID=A0AAD5R822_PARTN|nr:hypothetical protein KIN20_033379 [Parelaphostrongylus tenuis]KAJ1374296.1 hypothetical protein KIN20_036955 [Parelaphostrongylus tenuis]
MTQNKVLYRTRKKKASILVFNLTSLHALQDIIHDTACPVPSCYDGKPKSNIGFVSVNHGKRHSVKIVRIFDSQHHEFCLGFGGV